MLLDAVSFAADPGMVVGVIGPNGAGKTTLLEAMVGLRGASAGVVTFQGEPLKGFRDRARIFSFLPDVSILAPELDARVLVDHALRFRPRSPRTIDELRQALRVAELLDVPSGLLSRGERQRIALFCALAVDRPVVVLDEPFHAFDPLQLRDVFAAVRHVAETGTSVVTAIHQLGDAQKIARRVLLLADGRRVAWGNLDSLRSETSLPDGSLEDVFVALLERRVNAA